MSSALAKPRWKTCGALPDKQKDYWWLEHASDHGTGAVWAYGFGRWKQEVLRQLQALLEPFRLGALGNSYAVDFWR
jgi:hypothetical protein